MKMTEVRKKLKRIKSLIDEFNTIGAVLKSAQTLNSKLGIEPDENYLSNIKKRRDKILNEFDSLLK